MKLLEIIEFLRSKAAKRIAYGALIILIVVDFIIPRHEMHFLEIKSPVSGLYSALSPVY